MGTRAAGRPRPEPRGGGHSPGWPAEPGGGAGRSRPTRVPRPPLQRRRRRAGAARRVGRARPEERRVWKVVAKLRRRAGGGGVGVLERKTRLLRVERGRGGERRRVPLPERRWVEEVGAGQAGGTHTPGPRRAMAGERTRRFTRSLLRPGQAAELRHSAASAAAVAVSSRQQQRVSAARPPRLPRAPRAAGDLAPAAGSPRAPGRPSPGRPPLPLPRKPSPSLLALRPAAPPPLGSDADAWGPRGRVWGPGTFRGETARTAEAQRGRGCAWVGGVGAVRR